MFNHGRRIAQLEKIVEDMSVIILSLHEKEQKRIEQSSRAVEEYRNFKFPDMIAGTPKEEKQSE